MEQKLGLAIQSEQLSKLSACRSALLYKQEEEQTGLSCERGVPREQSYVEPNV